MKNLIFSLCALSATSVLASDAQYNLLPQGAFDVAAPVVNNRSNLGNAVAGQIVYDSSSQAFFGLPVGADPTTGSNWLPLSTSPGSANVISGGTERIERVQVLSSCNSSPCTIDSQSGSWVSQITRTTTGTYTVDIVPGTFSAAPTCMIQNQSILSYKVNALGVVSATSIAFTTYVQTGATTYALANDGFSIICQGPR